MRRWQWEIRRSADYAESVRHYIEDWDESGDHEVYPPARHLSFRDQFSMVLNDACLDDDMWVRKGWGWALWQRVRALAGIIVARWERWREPEWLKDPHTLLYFKAEGE